MSRAESLALELDTLKVELERLKSENARLRTTGTTGAGEEQLERTQELNRENERQKELYGQAVKDLQDKQKEVEETRQQLGEDGERAENTLRELEVKLDQEKQRNTELQDRYEDQRKIWEHQRSELELEKYRTLEKERQKWEEREARLVQQLSSLQHGHSESRCQSSVQDSHSIEGGSSPMIMPPRTEIELPVSPLSTEGQSTSSRESTAGSIDSTHTINVQEEATTVTGIQPQVDVPDGASSSTNGQSVVQQPPMSSLSLQAALSNQQMIQIPKFSGEQSSDYESFEEWQEQFELVANACQWNESAKLVNLATRLKDQAYSFNRSCTPDQRAKYSILAQALKKRFTPVRLQAVQSSLFHERKQGNNETVDTYAQELKRLFYKAYPHTLRGTNEAEAMGKSVLASQFVAGLRQEVKIKLAGNDGDIEQLLVKACFEEAKIKELGTTRSVQHTDTTRTPMSLPTAANQRPTGSKNSPSDAGRRGRERTNNTCHGCNGTGHYIRQCPFRKTVSKETRTTTNSKVARITPTSTEQEPASRTPLTAQDIRVML
jgi:hypothetical protein